MPQLIDADELRLSAIEITHNSEFAFDHCFPYWQFSKAIREAPTVEAIPVEWLEKRIEKCKSSKDLYPQLFEEIMTIVIAEWRKENEIERCR